MPKKYKARNANKKMPNKRRTYKQNVKVFCRTFEQKKWKKTILSDERKFT